MAKTFKTTFGWAGGSEYGKSDHHPYHRPADEDEKAFRREIRANKRAKEQTRMQAARESLAKSLHAGGRGSGKIGPKQSKWMHDAIARSMGWKNHADALAHRGPDGKVGFGPNYKPKNIEKSEDWQKQKNVPPEVADLMEENPYPDQAELLKPTMPKSSAVKRWEREAKRDRMNKALTPARQQQLRDIARDQHAGSASVPRLTGIAAVKSIYQKADKPKGIEAHGVMGMQSKPWRKQFKSAEHMNKWVEAHQAEVHATRDLDDLENEQLHKSSYADIDVWKLGDGNWTPVSESAMEAAEQGIGPAEFTEKARVIESADKLRTFPNFTQIKKAFDYKCPKCGKGSHVETIGGHGLPKSWPCRHCGAEMGHKHLKTSAVQDESGKPAGDARWSESQWKKYKAGEGKKPLGDWHPGDPRTDVKKSETTHITSSKPDKRERIRVHWGSGMTKSKDAPWKDQVKEPLQGSAFVPPFVRLCVSTAAKNKISKAKNWSDLRNKVAVSKLTGKPIDIKLASKNPRWRAMEEKITSMFDNPREQYYRPGHASGSIHKATWNPKKELYISGLKHRGSQSIKEGHKIARRLEEIEASPEAIARAVRQAKRNLREARQNRERR